MPGFILHLTAAQMLLTHLPSHPDFPYPISSVNDFLIGNLLPDADRLTKFGKLLRATSMDELPELFNIWKGDMSIIGPRPLLVSYLPWYTEEERLRHTVRPGLTGLAQVSGRNFLDWDSRLSKDVEYVKNLSFAMAIKVLVKTVTVVFARDEVAEDTSVSEGNLAEIRKKRQEAQV